MTATRSAVLEHQGLSEPYAQSKPLRIRELELGPVGPTELLVKMGAAGVCHSDLHAVRGGREWPVPMVLGHEASGTVQEVGSDVVGLAPGDQVTITFVPRCEECEACGQAGKLPCERGVASNNAGELLSGGVRFHDGDEEIRHHIGVCAFSQYTIVDQASVVKVPRELPAEIAALFGCAMITGGGALMNDAQPKSGDTIMVVGVGGVGLATILMALTIKEATVIAVDGLQNKLEHALAIGAHKAMTPAEVIEKGVKADVVIEAAGNVKAFETGVKALAVGGTLVTASLPKASDMAEISPQQLTAGGRTLRGSYMGSAVPNVDIPKYVELYQAGKLPLEHLVSSYIELDEINEAMDRLANGSELRQIIRF